MKHTSVQLLLTALLTIVVSASHAEEKQKLLPSHNMPGKNALPMQHGMGGMMGMMSEEQKEQHLKGMQEHMLQMHDLSNQILAEKDPAKKEQLKAQQLDLMKAHHAQMMTMHHPMKHGLPPAPTAAPTGK